MLNKEDLYLIESLRSRDPDAYELIQKLENDFLSLSSAACHNIRNCVALVTGYCQLIEDRSPDLAANPIYGKVSHNANLAIHKLDDIAAFRYSFHKKDIDTIMLSDITSQLISIYGPQLKVTNTSGITEFEGIFANILYALQSLICNSFEANAALVQLDITHTNSLLHFRFTDNGTGFKEISPQDAINPFFSTKKNHTGLGLSTAYNTALRHGGSLVILKKETPVIIDFSIKIKT